MRSKTHNPLDSDVGTLWVIRFLWACALVAPALIFLLKP